MRNAVRWVALITAIGIGPAGAAVVEPQAPPSSAPPAEVVRWVRQAAAPVDLGRDRPNVAESAAIDAMTAKARVIGFGESSHGNHEPLAYRNRLVRYLVERRGLTAVALESGLAESRQLYDYVLGKPGDAVELLRTGLTHGFGDLRENLALVAWLRAWNERHPARKVRLYGIDRSTILSGPPGKVRGVVLPHVAAYLERTVPDPSAAVRAVLKRFETRFTEHDYPAYPPADRAALDAALSATEALFVTHRAAMIARSGEHDYAWAQREAYDAARLPALFAVWNVDGSDLAKLAHVIDVRDRAMADHVRWVLGREGPRGRVLLFQTNGHVAKAAMVGSVMRDFTVQPTLTGIALRRALGARYRTIATVSSRGRDAGDAGSGSLDRAFAAAGRSPVLLDLGRPRPPAWWSRVQSASQGGARLDDYVPARAFDGLVYFDRLTPVTPLRPRPAS